MICGREFDPENEKNLFDWSDNLVLYYDLRNKILNLEKKKKKKKEFGKEFIRE